MHRRGQSSTENLLLVAFLAVPAYAFLPAFSEGGDGMTDDASDLWSAGTQDGRSGRP